MAFITLTQPEEICSNQPFLQPHRSEVTPQYMHDIKSQSCRIVALNFLSHLHLFDILCCLTLIVYLGHVLASVCVHNPKLQMKRKVCVWLMYDSNAEEKTYPSALIH